VCDNFCIDLTEFE
jgi:hypothetical protein